MSASCCEGKSSDLEKMAAGQRKVLWTVLGINAIMFFVELISGLRADSIALMGDSLDMLGDALAYGASLYVIGLSVTAKARSAMFKGAIIAFSSVSVLGAAVYRVFFQVTPEFHIMGIVGAVALLANLACLGLLTKYKNVDLNMSSVWLCSRNDIIANVSVLCAAGLVRLTGNSWPDLFIGVSLACLFARSALHIFSESRKTIGTAISIGENLGQRP